MTFREIFQNLLRDRKIERKREKEKKVNMNETYIVFIVKQKYISPS